MKKIIFSILTLLFCLGANAQGKERPWALGFGLNTTDASQYGVGEFSDLIFKDYVGPFVDTNSFLGRFYVARYLNKSFTIDFAASYNVLKKEYGEAEVLDDVSYISGDIGIRYDLNNLIGKTGWFDPYAKLGVGAVLINGSDGSIPFLGGFGFNTWFSDKWGLNFETNIKSSSHLSDVTILDNEIGEAYGIGDYHFQHAVSVVYQFGTGSNDADKDGIDDDEDECPETAGEERFKGCPDSDGDGIADKDDFCPIIAGSEATNGCPDSDEDGVADAADSCPNRKGSKELNGCPDSDGDGIADKDDRCPTMAGSYPTNGCPDSDGDGIADSDDKCPDVAGSKGFGGCKEPEVLKMTDSNVIYSKGELVETIYFKFASVALTYNDQTKLGEVLRMLKEDSSRVAGFYVEGHTDSVGAESVNLKISRKRAESVVEYLVSEGIDKSRLLILSHGESRPVASNATKSGRAKNRRVEITVVVLRKR